MSDGMMGASDGVAATPLAGVRVLDLGRFMAAPWCAQILGDLGAEVIKVERPGTGDQFRYYGPPFLQDEDGNDTRESAFYLSANRNKKSVAIDMSRAEGQNLVRQLAAKCNVLVENFRTGDLARYGLDYVSMHALNPQLVYASVTAFGQTGPYAARPGLDSVFQAMSGLMSVTGEPDGPPQKVGIIVMDIMAGLYAAIGVLAALRHREVLGGTGQQIDLALLDSAVAVMSHRAQDYFLTGEIPRRAGTATQGGAPAQIFATADGSINVQAGDEVGFRRLCALFDRADIANDPRFATRSDRYRNVKILIPLLESEFAVRTTAELHEHFVERQIVSAPIYTVDQTFDDPQVIHRRMKRDIPHPLGDMSVIASPLNFSETPTDTYRAPPMLGADTDAVLIALLELDRTEIARLRDGGVI